MSLAQKIRDRLSDIHCEFNNGEYDSLQDAKYSKENKIPLHPKFTYFWSDLDCREIIDLRNQLIKDATNVLENKFMKIDIKQSFS